VHYGCQLLNVLSIQRRQLGVDHLGQTAVGDEVAVGIRGGGEAVGYADAGGGEVSDHLAQRCVLAADLVEIGVVSQDLWLRVCKITVDISSTDLVEELITGRRWFRYMASAWRSS
jgi:hypothetical protein